MSEEGPKKPGAHLGMVKRKRTEKAKNPFAVHSLSKETQDKITAGLRAGNFRATSAEQAGVPVRTFREWMRRGKEKDEPYHTFRRAVLMAEKEAEAHAVGLVMKHAENDPKHAEWWLSHRFPERWADQERKRIRAEIKQQKLEVSVDLGSVTLEDIRNVLGDKARGSITEGNLDVAGLLGDEAPDVDP